MPINSISYGHVIIYIYTEKHLLKKVKKSVKYSAMQNKISKSNHDGSKFRSFVKINIVIYIYTRMYPLSTCLKISTLENEFAIKTYNNIIENAMILMIYKILYFLSFSFLNRLHTSIIM